MNDLVDTVIEVGVRIGIAALVVLAGYILAITIRRLAQRLLSRPNVVGMLGPSVVRLLGSAVYYLLLALTAGAALIALGASPATVGLVAVVLVALLALALRQSLADFAATVSILLFQPFRRGEMIETMGRIGTVQEILLLTTVLVLPDHRVVSLPNSEVQESGVVNYSRMGRIWSPFTLTVAYGEDLGRVRAIITEITAIDGRVLANPPFAVVVDELGENGVRLLAMPTVAPEHFWDVRNDLRKRIKARFDVEGIRFAAPRREVRLASEPAPSVSISGDSQRRD
jgi:small conductance mechanosensitive channel